MTQFEALTAHRSVASESIVTDTRQAIDGVLGEGAVDFSTANGGSLELLGEEELAVMHRITGALGELSVPDLIQTAAALLPRSFKKEFSPGIFRPQIITINGLRGVRREFILALSDRNRHRGERGAFTNAFDKLAGEEIPWQKPVYGIKMGKASGDVKAGKSELDEIRRRIPVREVKLNRGQAKRAKVLAA